jgi:hypothetical protein
MARVNKSMGRRLGRFAWAVVAWNVAVIVWGADKRNAHDFEGEPGALRGLAKDQAGDQVTLSRSEGTKSQTAGLPLHQTSAASAWAAKS